VDRLFLDANILFSAAYRPQAGLLALWRIEQVQLITSGHAVGEAAMNLDRPDQRARLDELVAGVEVMAQLPAEAVMPEGIDLPTKDRPILLAALATGATHLLTGDVRHFGAHFGRRVGGILILPPGEYLRSR